MTKYHNWPSNNFIESESHEGESKAYAVAVANLAGAIPGTFTRKNIRATKKLINYVKKLDGFLGVHPVPPHGTLLVFKTENDAKRARNLLLYDLKTQVGNNITEVFIPAEFLEGGNS